MSNPSILSGHSDLPAYQLRCLVSSAMLGVTRYFPNQGQKAAATFHKLLRTRFGYQTIQDIDGTTATKVITLLEEIETMAFIKWQAVVKEEKNTLLELSAFLNTPVQEMQAQDKGADHV